MEVNISWSLAFIAGLVSFLSPCVFPVVPGYITFISGMTLDELTSEDADEQAVRSARRQAALHALVFGLGFGLVFMSLGAAATAFGRALTPWLPTIARIGGVIVAGFGLYMLGVIRIGALSRERRFHFANKPSGYFGTLAVGIAFGAGWTPCIGPVLGSILFFAGLEQTVAQGTLLLGVYGLGLAVPFVGSAVLLNWFLAGAKRIRRHLGWIEKAAGGILLVMGILMISGYFITLTAWLADMGQLFTVELQ